MNNYNYYNNINNSFIICSIQCRDTLNSQYNEKKKNLTETIINYMVIITGLCTFICCFLRAATTSSPSATSRGVSPNCNNH